MKISYKLDEKELELLERVENKTCTDYGIEDNLLSADRFFDIIGDLMVEIDTLEEKLESDKIEIL